MSNASYPDWNSREGGALPLLGGRSELFSPAVAAGRDAQALRLHIARGRADLLRAYQLVYEAYLERGYVAPHPGKVVYRAVNGLPTSRTVVATTAAAQPVGTMTLIGDGPAGLPMESMFAAEVQALRAAGRSVTEISSFAVRASDGCPSTTLVFALTRFAVQYACWRGHHDLLFTVHPRHRRFYQRLFDAQQLGPCRPHPVMRDNPAVAYRIDLHQIGSLPLYRKYFAEAISEDAFRHPPIAPHDHLYLCERAGISPEASPDFYEELPTSMYPPSRMAPQNKPMADS